jgi:bacillithiol system protein YtxJ
MGLFGNSTKSTFPWTRLTTMEQLDELFAQSETVPVLLFKHSTSCNISAMVISRFESKWKADPSACICVYLDLIAYRRISNAIAEKTGIVHQSPQAILLKNGAAVYDESHGGIDAAHIQTLL